MNAVTQRFAGPSLTEQVWIEKKLGRPGLLDGKTNNVIFRDRLRAYLLSHELGSAPAGKKGGADESWAQLFARLYSEPLRNGETP